MKKLVLVVAIILILVGAISLVQMIFGVCTMQAVFYKNRITGNMVVGSACPNIFQKIIYEPVQLPFFK